MSVPTWKRKLSSAEYVYQLYQLNIRLGKVLENKPQKYKHNYTDEIIKTALQALKHVQTADSIYLTKYSTERDFRQRREHLLEARGQIQFIATACYVFLEIVRTRDYASENEHKQDIARLYDQEMEIGDRCEHCYNLVSGVIKADSELYNKFIKART